MTIYVATGNKGKLRDFALVAQEAESGEVTFAPLPQLDTIPAPAEDQDTFEGNARLKAEYYSRLAPGFLVLCDDSGLEVDALDGRPGVRSARFALDLGFGSPMDSADVRNNEALLLEMTEQTERGGRYRCVLALARDGAVLRTADGALEGEVLTAPEGTNGFGYDPLFYASELGCTMAQASSEERLRVSHRSRALRKLLPDLPFAD